MLRRYLSPSPCAQITVAVCFFSAGATIAAGPAIALVGYVGCSIPSPSKFWSVAELIVVRAVEGLRGMVQVMDMVGRWLSDRGPSGSLSRPNSFIVAWGTEVNQIYAKAFLPSNELTILVVALAFASLTQATPHHFTSFPGASRTKSCCRPIIGSMPSRCYNDKLTGAALT